MKSSSYLGRYAVRDFSRYAVRTLSTVFLLCLLSACQAPQQPAAVVEKASVQEAQQPQFSIEFSNKASAQCLKEIGALDPDHPVFNQIFYSSPDSANKAALIASTAKLTDEQVKILRNYMDESRKCRNIRLETLAGNERQEAYRTYYMQMNVIFEWILNRDITTGEANQLKALASESLEKNTQKPTVKYERDESLKQILASRELHRQCVNKLDTYPPMKRVDKEIFYGDSKTSTKPPPSATMTNLSDSQKQALRETIILNVECRQTRMLSLEGLTRFYNRDKSYHNAMDEIYKQLLSDQITIDEANTRFHRARKYWLRIEAPEGELS